MLNPLSNGLSNGRIIEFLHHDADPGWGGGTQQDSFAVIHPRMTAKTHGLYVVFHSAGHDLYSTIGCTFAPNNHDIYRTPDDMFGLYLDCRAHQQTDFWWGGVNAKGDGNPERRNTIQPVEHRVIDTVKWVIETYPIDPARVYAAGNSMGGSGALGIAMAHGELFAAVKVNVPAGVEHFMDRCINAPEPPPDMPVCIDYSAPDDSWSQGHEKLYRAAREHKFSLFGYWAPFGHENKDALMLAKNDLIHSLDWLAITRDAPYPAFTNATSDDANPWEYDIHDSKPGQVNAFFRWQNLQDSPESFSIRLFLETPQTLKTSFTIPTQATADVTLRRRSRFHPLPGQTIVWKYGSQYGMLSVAPDGLITVPALAITDNILHLSFLH